MNDLVVIAMHSCIRHFITFLPDLRDNIILFFPEWNEMLQQFHQYQLNEEPLIYGPIFEHGTKYGHLIIETLDEQKNPI